MKGKKSDVREVRKGRDGISVKIEREGSGRQCDLKGKRSDISEV